MHAATGQVVKFSFEYKSTPFCSAQVHDTFVLRYLYSYVMVGVYGTLYAIFVIIMRMLIICCHDEVM